MILMLFDYGCKTDTTDKDKYHHNSIKNIKTKTKFKYSYSFGKIDSIGEKKFVEYYDKDGKLTERITYSNKKLYTKEIIRYDSLGRKIEELEYNKIGKLRMKNSYVYDEFGKIVERIPTPGDGMEESLIGFYQSTKEKYEYDAKNRLERKLTYRGDNWITYNTEYKYDFDNRIIEENWFDVNKLLISQNYFYDSLGFLSHIKEKNFLMSTYFSISTFDTSGNKIRTDFYDANWEKTENFILMKYNEDGFIVEETYISVLNEPNWSNIFLYTYY